MKRYNLYLVTLLLLIVTAELTAQLDSTFRLTASFGLEGHDKRLYDFPRAPSAELLQAQPEFCYTYSYEIGAEKRLRVVRRLHLGYAFGGGR